MSEEDALSDTCWFCRKGRHDDCMKKMPRTDKGINDCSFAIIHVQCSCCGNK